PKRPPALLAVEQHEGGEVRQIAPVAEDEGRFQAAVSKKNAATALWQVMPVLGHSMLSMSAFSSWVFERQAAVGGDCCLTMPLRRICRSSRRQRGTRAGSFLR